jgi:hypothetical protein
VNFEITRFNCISKTQQIHDLIKIKSIFTDTVISSNIPLGFMSEFIFSMDQSEMSLPFKTEHTPTGVLNLLVNIF